jgi:quercetin dioxygenase-like cupin family protein
MTRSFTNSRLVPATLTALALGLLLAGPIYRVAGDETGAEVKLVTTQALPNVPGKSVSAVLVSYPPGGRSGKHHHAGSVLAYVLSGEIRSENSATGPVRVYKAGETFFEPAGSEHLVSENASATAPASLLAIFVADDGAQLTTFDQ